VWLSVNCSAGGGVDNPFYPKADTVENDIEAAQDVYNALCLNYSEWVEAGKPAKGWLPAEAIKVFF